MGAIRDRLLDIALRLAGPAAREASQTAAAYEMAARMKPRIFDEGKATDGSPIGGYSTKPGSFPVNYPGLPRSQPQRRADGTAKKTKFFSDGYAGFRKDKGRQAQTVDLNLTGSTATAFQVGTSDGRVVFGITNERARSIMAGNEKRFGRTISAPSEEERSAAAQAGVDAFFEHLRNR